MMEEKEELRDELVSWRSWIEEKVNSQNKWVLRIIFGFLTISIVGVIVLLCFHLFYTFSHLKRPFYMRTYK
jgi:hypothetical protein